MESKRDLVHILVRFLQTWINELGFTWKWGVLTTAVTNTLKFCSSGEGCSCLTFLPAVLCTWNRVPPPCCSGKWRLWCWRSCQSPALPYTWCPTSVQQCGGSVCHVCLPVQCWGSTAGPVPPVGQQILFFPVVRSVWRRKGWGTGCDSWQLGSAKVTEGGVQYNTRGISLWPGLTQFVPTDKHLQVMYY